MALRSRYEGRFLPDAVERPGLLLGDATWAADGDGYGRLHGVAFVVALGDSVAVVDEDFGDGVVEEDVEVEWTVRDAADFFVSDARGAGLLMRIRAEQDDGALVIEERLL